MNSFCNTVSPSTCATYPNAVNGFGYGYNNAGTVGQPVGVVNPLQSFPVNTVSPFNGVLPTTVLNGCSIPGPTGAFGFTQPGLFPSNIMNTQLPFAQYPVAQLPYGQFPVGQFPFAQNGYGLNTPALFPQGFLTQNNIANGFPFGATTAFNTLRGVTSPWTSLAAGQSYPNSFFNSLPGTINTPWNQNAWNTVGVNSFGWQNQLPIAGLQSFQHIFSLPQWQQNVQQIVSVLVQPIWNNLVACFPQINSQPQLCQQLYTQICGTIFNCCCTPAFIGWCTCTLGLTGNTVQNPQAIATLTSLPQWQQIVPQIASCFFQPILNTIVAFVPQIITTPTLFQQLATQLYTTITSCCCTPTFVGCCLVCGQCCTTIGINNTYGNVSGGFGIPQTVGFNSPVVNTPWLNQFSPVSPIGAINQINPFNQVSPLGVPSFNTLPTSSVLPFGGINNYGFSNYGINTPGYLQNTLPGLFNQTSLINSLYAQQVLPYSSPLATGGIFNTLNTQLPFNPLFSQIPYGQLPYGQIPFGQVPFNGVTQPWNTTPAMPYGQTPGYANNLMPQNVHPFATPAPVGENGDASMHMRNAV